MSGRPKDATTRLILRQARQHAKKSIKDYEEFLADLKKNDEKLYRVVMLICTFPGMRVYQLLHRLEVEYTGDPGKFVTKLAWTIRYSIEKDFNLHIKYEVYCGNAEGRAAKYLLHCGGKQDNGGSLYNLTDGLRKTVFFSLRPESGEGLLTFDKNIYTMPLPVTSYISNEEPYKHEECLTVGELHAWLEEDYHRYLKDETDHWINSSRLSDGTFEEDSLQVLLHGRDTKTEPFYFKDVLGRRHWNPYSRKLYKMLKGGKDALKNHH